MGGLADTDANSDSAPPADATALSTTLAQAVESFGKVLIVVGALCYVCGLLVVNIYLRQFGFSEFSLLRTRFVLTGAILLVPFVATLGIIWILTALLLPANRLFSLLDVAGLRRVEFKPSIKNLSLFLFMLFTVVAFLHVYFQFVLGMSRSDYSSVLTLALTSGILAPICILFLIVSVLRRSQVSGSGAKSARLSTPELESQLWVIQPSSVGGIFVQSTLCFLALFAHLTIFATLIYPRIPEQVGGGQPKIVQLVLFPDNVAVAESAGLEISNFRTTPIPLLWESESAYLVLLPNAPEQGWTAQVSKSLVAGLLTAPRGNAAQVVLPAEWNQPGTSFSLPTTPNATAPSATATIND